jgi:very-short-patch-repair endonuclease
MYDEILTRRAALTDLSPTELQRLVRAGTLHHTFRGVYIKSNGRRGNVTPAAVRRAALTYADLAPAAARYPAYLCCHSAAAESELPTPHLSEVSVGVPRGRIVTDQPGLLIHRHGVDEASLVIRNGVRLVDRHLALAQAFTVLPKDERRQLVIRSIQERLVAPDLVRQAISRTARHRRELLDLLALTEAGSHSELEIAAMSRVLIRYGVAHEFEQQYSQAMPRRHTPMDFAAVALRINLEADGSRYHSRPEQRRDDVRRDLDLKRHKWAVIRCQYENVLDEPERVAAALLVELLERGWTGRPTTGEGRLLLATLRS